MQRHALAASLALAVLAVFGLGDPAVAGDQVPFRGSLEGSATFTPLRPPLTLWVVGATGNATQLGEFTFTMPHVVDGSTRMATGTFEFVAANGDTLFGTQTGVASLTSTPNVFSIVETAIITGGTGRFAEATGGFTIERLFNRVTGVTSGSFAGTVSSVGAGN